MWFILFEISLLSPGDCLLPLQGLYTFHILSTKRSRSFDDGSSHRLNPIKEYHRLYSA